MRFGYKFLCAGVLFLVFPAGESSGALLTFPAGARRFIYLNNTSSSDVPPLLYPVGTAGDLPLTDFTTPIPYGGGTGQAYASASGNGLRSLLRCPNGVSENIRLFNGFVDTYTLHGPVPDEAVPFTLSVHLEGAMQHLVGGVSQGFLDLAIGDWAPRDTPNPAPVGIANRVSFTHIFTTFDSAPSLIIDVTPTVNLIRQVGIPFDLAYGLTLASNARVEWDISHTAAINFSLPPGYTLTSEMGWGEASGCTPRGDVNYDGQVNAQDVAAFVNLLLAGAPAAPNCRADVNADSALDAGDIQAFVNCIVAGQCP